MLSIHALEFGYPDSDFSLAIERFEIAPGEKLAVIGPSGSGKTTLLNLVSGIIRPDRGEMRIADTQIEQLSDTERRDFRISSSLKLTAEVRQRAHELADRADIGAKLDRYAGELSQGEKQRVAICRALLPNPKLVFADEATGNLDPRNKDRILDLLFDSVDAHDATLLAVTHDHELLPRFDRVVDFLDFRDEAFA